MNQHRTLYSRNAFAAAALSLLGSVSTVPAHAQAASRAQVRADVITAQGEGSLGSVAAQWGLDTQGRPLGSAGTVSRAEVRAATEQALATGRLDANPGERYGMVAQPSAGSSLSRAEVRDAAIAAVRDGRLDAQLGESDGTRPVALRAARRVL